MVGAVRTVVLLGELDVLERPHTLRKAIEPDEAGRIALLVDVVLTESDEALIVQRLLRGAAGYRDRSLVELERDGSRDALLHHVHECVVRLLLRGPPAS